MRRACASLILVALALHAEPVTATLPKAELSAEYMVHSVLYEEQNALVRDYLCIEIDFKPAKGQSLTLSADQFHLRLNGKKQLLFAQAPQMVAAGLKYDDWEQRPTMVAGGGMGNGGIVLGRPQQTERFPGDTREAQRRVPGGIPRAPEPENRSGQERVVVKPEEIVVKAALPEGPIRTHVKGYIYFAFKGKPSSLKRVELLYTGPAGETSLLLK